MRYKGFHDLFLKNNLSTEELLMKFNRDVEFNELRSRYNTSTILDILGVGRSETSHSAMLAWLLQGNSIIADQKNTPLMRFLDILIRRDDSQSANKIDNDVRRAIIGRSVSLTNVKVTTEKSISKLPNVPEELKKCSDRIDIYATANFYPAIKQGDQNIKNLVLVIENKVKSSEGANKGNIKKYGKVYEASDQTKRYYLAVMPNAMETETRKYSEDETSNIPNGEVEYKATTVEDTCYIFVYLTPLSNSLLDKYERLDIENKPACPQYIQINYQDIADDILIPLLKLGNQAPRISAFLEEYMNSLTIPGTIDSEDDDKSEECVIMATTKSDRELLYKFCKEYWPIIEKAAWLEAKKMPDELKNYIVDLVEKDTSIDCLTLKNIFGEAVIYSNEPANDQFFIREGKKVNKNVIRMFAKQILHSNVSDELSILENFKDQNITIVSAALKILADSGENFPNYDLICKLYNLVSKSTPRTKYKFNNEVIYGHTNLVVKVVSEYAKDKTVAQVTSTFNKNENLRNGFDTVYDCNTIPSDTSRYSHVGIKCTDGVVYCNNQWIPENTKQFVDYVNAIGLQVQIV